MSCTLIMLPIAANAAAIINITDQEAPFELQSQQDWVPIPIAPGGRFYIPGDARVRWKNRVVRIQYDEEYALWPDGTFGPQRRLRFLGSRD